jgi:hypothetical protein
VIVSDESILPDDPRSMTAISSCPFFKKSLSDSSQLAMLNGMRPAATSSEEKKVEEVEEVFRT